MTDIVSIVDKTTHELSALGNIQTEFNMSNVIDGTKDSLKIIVNSFNGDEVEPFTILRHDNTNTWWCVSSDRVTRYMNEQNTYFYTHELKLLGAIEIINARDLIDHGYNQNTYTVGEVINRIFTMSTFEYSIANIITNNEISLDKNVDYVKTFENYTPLTALREFLDGYNCVAKMTFNVVSNVCTSANLIIYSKTGNASIGNYNDDIFENVDEVKNIGSDSFGTSVVSNAENVISTKTKTFPTLGGIRLSSNSFNIEPNNAILRLPSPAYKVNLVKMFMPLNVTINYVDDNISMSELIKVYPQSNASLSNFKNEIINKIRDTFVPPYDEAAIEQLEDEWETICEKMLLASSVSFYGGNQVNALTGEIVKGNDVPYLPKIHMYKTDSDGILSEEYVALVDEETGSNLLHPNTAINFKRNSDLLTNFKFLQIKGNHPSIDLEETDYRDYDTSLFNISTTFSLELSSGQTITYYDLSFQIKYIPMGDLKVKYDNLGDRLDTQKYNQNGKLTDSVSLSKLLLSYSKEIQSDNITRYGTYYNYNNVPKVGSVVEINDSLYVINSASLDFFQNEDGYYISGEFTLSKAIAIKSLMVNPNTNIRDYGIPQSNNIKRKQLYRDFYELDYELYAPVAIERLGLDKILNVTNWYKPYQEHVAVIELTFDNAYGKSGNESDTWYYQLETTTYVMKKAIYEVVDFKDNNIIGYGSQNVWCGFVISRVFQNQTDAINTPISYVDDKGRVKGIEIAFCNNEQITEIYDGYQKEQEDILQSTYDGLLYNYSVFIPREIWHGGFGYSGAFISNDFSIAEQNYEKDALEVPVFEYSCQIDDSNNVIIGNNILDTFESDKGYIYLFKSVTKNSINDNNFESIISGNEVPNVGNTYSASGVVKMEIGSQLLIQFYDYMTLNTETLETNYGSSYSPTHYLTHNSDDMVIIRHEVASGRNDLMFIIKNIHKHRNTNIVDGKLVLNKNYYKLK